MNKFKWLISSLLLVWSMTGFAVVVATVDRDEIQPTDSLVLTISSTTTTSGSPDLSPLAKDFDVFSSGQRMSVEVINGQLRQFSSWQIAMSPKHSGKITIPAIRVGHESTKPIVIKVSGHVASKQAVEDFIIETEVTPRDAFVQQQMIYTQRVWCARNIRNGELSPLSVQGKANIERFGEDVQSTRTRSNRHYQVVERRYLVFAQDSGNLTFEAPVLRALTYDSNPTDFWSQRKPTQIRVTGNALHVNVKPQPASFQGAWWLPAEQVKLTEEWSDSQDARVGEPITRTVTLKAYGLKAQQLPELKFEYPAQLNNYPDKSVMDTKIEKNQVIGTRQFKVALIPTQPGKIILPQVKVQWFNTKTNKSEEAVLPAKVISITGAASSAPPANNEIKPTPQLPATLPPVEPAKKDSLWQWLGMSFAGLWLFTLLILFWVIKKRKANKSTQPKIKITKPSLRHATKSLKTACNRNDAKSAQFAILEWAKANWPDQGFTNLEQVAETVNDPELTNAIRDLLTSCYRDSSTAWQGKSFWKTWERATKVKKNAVIKDELPSLYS